MNKTQAIGTVGRMWADNVSTKFSDSLCEMFIYEMSKLPAGKYINYDKARVSWHELGRNQLCEAVQGDWLLMLDTDHTFAPDLLERLMRVKRHANAEVITAIYQYKFPPHAPVLNMWNPEQDGSVRVLPVVDWDRKAEHFQVGVVPAGCLLIDKKVLKRIQRELKENPFALVPGLSEDYSFCYRCRKLNIPIHVAAQVEYHHIIPTVLSVKDYHPIQTDIQRVETKNGVIL